MVQWGLQGKRVCRCIPGQLSEHETACNVNGHTADSLLWLCKNFLTLCLPSTLATIKTNGNNTCKKLIFLQKHVHNYMSLRCEDVVQ